MGTITDINRRQQSSAFPCSLKEKLWGTKQDKTKLYICNNLRTNRIMQYRNRLQCKTKRSFSRMKSLILMRPQITKSTFGLLWCALPDQWNITINTCNYKVKMWNQELLQSDLKQVSNIKVKDRQIKFNSDKKTHTHTHTQTHTHTHTDTHIQKKKTTKKKQKKKKNRKMSSSPLSKKLQLCYSSKIGSPLPTMWQLCHHNLTEYIFNLHNC